MVERKEKSGKCLGVFPECLGRRKARSDDKDRVPWRRDIVH